MVSGGFRKNCSNKHIFDSTLPQQHAVLLRSKINQNDTGDSTWQKGSNYSGPPNEAHMIHCKKERISNSDFSWLDMELLSPCSSSSLLNLA